MCSPSSDIRLRRDLANTLAIGPLTLLLAGTFPVAAATGERASFEYVSPVPGSSMVSTWNTVVIRPGGPLAGARIDARSLDVAGAGSGPHAGVVAISDDGRTLVWKPARPFSLGERVRVRFDAPVTSRDGQRLAPLEFEFHVGTADPRRQRTLSLERLIDEAAGPAAGRGARAVASRPVGTLGTLVNACNPLPQDYPSFSVTTLNNPDPGNVFMSPFSGAQPVGRLLILDNFAQPMFYRRLPGAPAFDFKRQPNGLLTYACGDAFWALDSSYAVVDSFRMGNGYFTDIHELQLFANNHALLMAYDDNPIDMSVIVPGGRPDAHAIGLVIQELDQAKNVVFQWRSWDHFQITDMDTCLESLRDSLIDYVHGNAIELDTDGNLLISSRHMNEITKINRATGAIIWRMGRNAKNNQFSFPNDPRGWAAQHDIRRLPNGHITLFDNGNCLPGPYSRALEYQLDEVNKVATLIWQYVNTPPAYGGFMGDVQRRTGGGTMIGWGGTSPAATDLHADGSKAFQLGFASPSMWTYRAYRFPWSTSMFALSPDSVDFGRLGILTTATRNVTVRNRTNKPIIFTCATSSDSSFTVTSALPFTLGAGATTTLTVKATGVTLGANVATLYVRTASDTSLVAQSVGLKSSVLPSLPATGRAPVALLGGAMLGVAAWVLRRRRATLAMRP